MFHRTRNTSVSFYRTTGYNTSLSFQAATSLNSQPSKLSPYSKFRMALKSKEVQRQYPILLSRFLDFCKFDGLDIEDKSLKFSLFAKSKTQEEVEDLVMTFVLFQKERIDKKEITAGTLRNYVKAIKLFCRMNRINIFWDMISKSLPKVKQYANDRIPTLEEITKLIDYPDRRIKFIVLLSLATGIRVGAWDYMRWKHITPIKDEDGVLIAAKLVVYAGEIEEYFTFMTPEAYNAVKEWMEFRAELGSEKHMAKSQTKIQSSYRIDKISKTVQKHRNQDPSRKGFANSGN